MQKGKAELQIPLSNGGNESFSNTLQINIENYYMDNE